MMVKDFWSSQDGSKMVSHSFATLQKHECYNGFCTFWITLIFVFLTIFAAKQHDGEGFRALPRWLKMASHGFAARHKQVSN